MGKIWIRLITVVLLLQGGVAWTRLAAQQRTESSLYPELDEVFAEWDQPGSPGCALAVVKDGKILYARGYGMADLEHDIPISSTSVFYIGSVSKQFVAMCILLLEEEGKLSLDDTIQKYLPDFPEYEAPITIAQLIHHTSGMSDYLSLWTRSGRSMLDHMPEEQVYELICSQEQLSFTPGEDHRYSNSGYFLLSMIVKKASGKSLREYADEHIFTPLGMEHSHFHDNHMHLIKNRAFGYAPLSEGGFGNMTMRFDLVGSGGLYSTVEDLYLWDQNFYDNKLGSGGPDLIECMLTNGRLNDGSEIDYAKALVNYRYRGARAVMHRGAFGGYRAQLLRFPDHRFSVILLCNLASMDPTSLAFKLSDIVLEADLDPVVTE